METISDAETFVRPIADGVPEVLEEPWTVSSGSCDYSGRLGIADTFTLFQDIATDHALLLGVGFRQIEPLHLFWLTVKTKIVFHEPEQPLMADDVIVRTWPEEPDKMRVDRSYELEYQGRVVASGKTEWAIINMETNRLQPIASIFPTGLAYDRPSAVEAPYVRVAGSFADVPVYATYTVRSTDIDLGGHMNNVAYVRAMLGTFSVAEQQAMRIAEIDAIFRSQCYEGDTLDLKRRFTDDGLDVCMEHEGKAMFVAHLVCDTSVLAAE